MFDNVKSTLSKAVKSRILILILVLIILAFILIQRLFHLQIINGESYQTDFTMQIKLNQGTEKYPWKYSGQ